jgi:hypothetical protein
MTISKSLIGLCVAGATLASASSVAVMFFGNPAQAIGGTGNNPTTSSADTVSGSGTGNNATLTVNGTTYNVTLPLPQDFTVEQLQAAISAVTQGISSGNLSGNGWTATQVPWELDGTATIFGSITGIGIGLGLKRLTSKKNINLKNS